VPPTLTLTAYVTGSTQPGGESPSTPVVYEFTSDASGTKLTPMAVSPMPSGTSGSLTTLQYLAVRSSQGTSGAYYLDTLLTADVMNAYALDSSNGSISPPPPPQPTYNTGPQPTSLDAIGSVKCIETSCDDGNFIYVANSKDGTISLFTQSSFGTITTPPKIQPGRIEGLSSLADDSYYLYATGSRGVWAFAPSTTDGSLKAVDGSPFAAGGGPGPIATTQPWYAGIVNPYFSEALNLVYTVNVTDRTISAFTINVKTGQLTSLTGPAVTTGAGPTSIIVQPRPAY
jgi:hypothetical protein